MVNDKQLKNLTIGVGLNQVDGLKPSKYFYEVVNSSNSYNEIEEKLRNYYKSKDTTEQSVKDEKECDLVSKRIAEVLEDESFVFSPISLKTIHKKLFDGVFEGKLALYVGKFKDYSIKKSENVLNGDSVVYGDYAEILEYLKYDFDNESKKNYAKFSQHKQVEHLAKFISNVWQIHPFGEGNTRTVALFAIKYLKQLGFNVNNDVFAEHSKYFRDALVLSNYTNVKLGLQSEYKYLESFFAKLIIDKNVILEQIKPVNFNGRLAICEIKE